MAQLAIFLLVVGVTAALAAGWILALVTGRLSLIGPLVRVNRARRPVSYVALMALSLLPIVSG